MERFALGLTKHCNCIHRLLFPSLAECLEGRKSSNWTLDLSSTCLHRRYVENFQCSRRLAWKILHYESSFAWGISWIWRLLKLLRWTFKLWITHSSAFLVCSRRAFGEVLRLTTRLREVTRLQKHELTRSFIHNFHCLICSISSEYQAIHLVSRSRRQVSLRTDFWVKPSLGKKEGHCQFLSMF